MNSVQTPTLESNGSIDKLALAKQLAKDVARGTGAGIMWAVFALIAALIVNAIGVAIFIDTSAGSGLPFLALVALPFLAGVAVTVVMAYKLGLQGVLARVVESQSGLIARVGSSILEAFLRAMNYQPGADVTTKFIEQWQNYLQVQANLPKPLPWLLERVTSMIPLSDIIADVAKPGMALRDVAHGVMTRILQDAATGDLRPSYQVLLVALAVQLGMWYPISMLARHWLG